MKLLLFIIIIIYINIIIIIIIYINIIITKVSVIYVKSRVMSLALKVASGVTLNFTVTERLN